MKRASCILPVFSLALFVVASNLASAAEEQHENIFASERLPPGEILEPWTHTCCTSAVIFWQTENRAATYVEYGPTPRCERQTPRSQPSPVSRQPYWTHFHRLTGLEPEQTYHYRMICVGTDGTQRASETKTFQTRSAAGAVRIPEDLAGPPYILDRKGANYLVTKDLVCPLGAIHIKADGVTVDLDGHTLTYNQEPGKRPAEWNIRAHQEHDFGIKVQCRGRATVLNGVIRQGPGNSPGTPVGIGCNPVYSGNGAVEVAGLEIVWAGPDISGLYLHWGTGNHVHHCVMEDLGTHITNRHQAISTIDGNGWGDYHHNLVKLTRQQGLMAAVNAHHNEVYINSYATNSFGIVPSPKAGRPVDVGHNKIIGLGEHPVGIAMFGVFAPGSTVHDNRVEVKCTRSGQEYGYTGSACFRTTWGADNLDVSRNTFIALAGLDGGKVAKARTLWVGLPNFRPKDSNAEVRDARGVFRDNLIVARGEPGATAGAICVVCLNQSPNLIFLNNTVVSTWGNVLLSDSYGDADGYPKFVGNTFQREGQAQDYFTIRQEYSGRPATGVFLGNQCRDGADLEQPKLLDKGQIAMADLVEVAVKEPGGQALAGAKVTIRDASGATLFDGLTRDKATQVMLVAAAGPSLAVEHPVREDAKGYIESRALQPGRIMTVLVRYTATAAGRSDKGPYRLEVAKEGYQPASQNLPAVLSGPIEIVLNKR